MVTRRSNPDHHSPLPLLALAVPRTQIEPHAGDKRYVRRKKGTFTKSQDTVGRSLTADRRKRAKTVVKSGEGSAAERDGAINIDWLVPMHIRADSISPSRSRAIHTAH